MFNFCIDCGKKLFRVDIEIAKLMAIPGTSKHL